jgi:hypothetical protein
VPGGVAIVYRDDSFCQIHLGGCICLVVDVRVLFSQSEFLLRAHHAGVGIGTLHSRPKCVLLMLKSILPCGMLLIEVITFE